ncbi:hypothetical protein A2662_03795 [Candidatus Giovannonibacteria bacterium RIFCSPHIGHO2_01_FULL_45_33]|uniref:Uncharacterized protein n=1 Tax=Candidatus Giovannonibacteria bacterium RIFCSPLOWO2_01_FULL_45_34 TaxID=1798351 RepID=A0A1F5X001_9BACT|nr:MAG: hypothetical protein A2662_03795 [Candidatus Giovannonibacteria bacterium RIFCSPHIGHO2_01_FULL_45_33]OGF81226.1 MAG: hypothetical protein A2930_02060 [Candidatus Giovannonibacteria bacterium RIFCSPLOWO2_01_FULL_45_34]
MKLVSIAIILVSYFLLKKFFGEPAGALGVFGFALAFGLCSMFAFFVGNQSNGGHPDVNLKRLFSAFLLVVATVVFAPLLSLFFGTVGPIHYFSMAIIGLAPVLAFYDFF